MMLQVKVADFTKTHTLRGVFASSAL